MCILLVANLHKAIQLYKGQTGQLLCRIIRIAHIAAFPPALLLLREVSMDVRCVGILRRAAHCRGKHETVEFEDCNT